MNQQTINDLETNHLSLLNSHSSNKKMAFWLRKQQIQGVNKKDNVKVKDDIQRKVIIRKGKGLPDNIDSKYLQSQQGQTKNYFFPNNENINEYDLDESERIQFYSLVGQIKQIQQRQKKMKKWMSSFICWVTTILFLVIVFFIIFLKTLFFFNTQLIGTIMQSFKEQIFDPKITNDQLQLQVFYIEQGFFILTVILIFLFILTFTVIVNKYYQKRMQKYRNYKITLKNLHSRKEHLLQRTKQFSNLKY